jgi:hypothetical protein
MQKAMNVSLLITQMDTNRCSRCGTIDMMVFKLLAKLSMNSEAMGINVISYFIAEGIYYEKTRTSSKECMDLMLNLLIQRI